LGLKQFSCPEKKGGTPKPFNLCPKEFKLVEKALSLKERKRKLGNFKEECPLLKSGKTLNGKRRNPNS